MYLGMLKKLKLIFDLSPFPIIFLREFFKESFCQKIDFLFLEIKNKSFRITLSNWSKLVNLRKNFRKTIQINTHQDVIPN